MVEEIAFIEVQEGKQDAFEEAVRIASKDIFPRSQGFVSLSLGRGIERPNTFALKIKWESVEDHTIGFVQSELFGAWSVLVADLLGDAPIVEHWQPVDLV